MQDTFACAGLLIDLWATFFLPIQNIYDNSNHEHPVIFIIDVISETNIFQ